MLTLFRAALRLRPRSDEFAWRESPQRTMIFDRGDLTCLVNVDADRARAAGRRARAGKRAGHHDRPSPRTPQRGCGKERHEDVTRNLGLRQHGDTLQRGRVQARADGEVDRGEGTHRRRRARRLDRRLRVPLPAGARACEPRRGARRARRARDLLHRERAPPRSALRQGRLRLARRRHPRGSAAADARGDRPRRGDGRADDHLARDRGLQLPLPDAVPGVVGALRRRGRPGRAARERARRHRLPRAQELGAGDEDPDAERRDDAARDPFAAARGDRQRHRQHGLAAPADERRIAGGVRGHARRRGAARPPARERRLGHVRRRQHGRDDPLHGDARARGRAATRAATGMAASGSASTSIPTRRTRSARSKRSVLHWRFIDGIAARIDDAELRAAQAEKDAVRAYELVYAAMGA